MKKSFSLNPCYFWDIDFSKIDIEKNKRLIIERIISYGNLNELKDIQAKYQESTFAFGQLYIEKLNLKEREKEIETIESKIKQELLDAQKGEQAWIDKISTKYGDGNLSLKDGTFTPNAK